MADRISDLGTSQEVVRAFAAVPRELFVPSFFSFPPEIEFGNRSDIRDWRADEPDIDPQVVELVYDEGRALGIARGPNGMTTSTVSAPQLLAAMLDQLRLQPGLRVFEVGAGSGYTAALLAEMVGDASLVTTVDIDADLVASARERLDRAGYPAVEVVTADGVAGAPDRAPFDRIVATVGCTDLSPAWFDQLAPGGFALVPVQHGGLHPLMKARTEKGRVISRVVGRAGFVVVQGHQAPGRKLWPYAGRVKAVDEPKEHPLPDELSDVFSPPPERERLGNVPLWDFSFYLALAEPRTAHLGAVADADRSSAAIGREGKLRYSGPSGRALADDLVAHATAWDALGRPGAGDFDNEWLPKSTETPDVGSAGWVIDRVDYRQVVRLEPYSA